MIRKPRLTYEEVARAIVSLLRKGQNPSLDAIHEAVGNRGSRTTVHKFKNQWMERLGQQDAVNLLPATVPKELMPMIDELWGVAVDQAGRAHAEDKAALESMASRAREAEHEQAAALEDTRQALLETRHALEREKDRSRALVDKVGALERVEADLKHRLIAAENRIKDLTDAREHDRLHYDQLLEAERSEHRRQLEHLQQQVTDITAQKELEIRRSDKDIDFFQRQLANERDEKEALKKEHASSLNFLQRQVDAKSQQYAKMEARYDDQVKAAEVSRLEWGRERELLVERAELASQEVTRLEEERQALTSQISSLQTQLDATQLNGEEE